MTEPAFEGKNREENEEADTSEADAGAARARLHALTTGRRDPGATRVMDRVSQTDRELLSRLQQGTVSQHDTFSYNRRT
jgi:hypothetical protein